MLELIRTTSQSTDFQVLVRLLDAYLREVDGDDHAYYAQFNKIDALQHVVIAYRGGQAVGCGAIKAYEGSAEVKRMYVRPENRGEGIAGLVLLELENWAKELGFLECILETGKKQPSAVRLYEKSGYEIIPNYGQYQGMDASICMKKRLD